MRARKILPLGRREQPASAVPLQDEESLSEEEPIAQMIDGVRPAHNGARRRARIRDEEPEPVELDRFIDPSELWP